MKKKTYNHRRRWLDCEVQFMLDERSRPESERLTIEQIAERLGRDEDCVKYKWKTINPNGRSKYRVAATAIAHDEIIAISKPDVVSFYEL